MNKNFSVIGSLSILSMSLISVMQVATASVPITVDNQLGNIIQLQVTHHTDTCDTFTQKSNYNMTYSFPDFSQYTEQVLSTLVYVYCDSQEPTNWGISATLSTGAIYAVGGIGLDSSRCAYPSSWDDMMNGVYGVTITLKKTGASVTYNYTGQNLPASMWMCSVPWSHAG